MNKLSTRCIKSDRSKINEVFEGVKNIIYRNKNKNMFKTREDKEEFIENLDGAMKVLHYRFHVFDGGCVYVAALLADGLEQLNIPFDVVIYEHPHKGKNLTPEQLASQGDICHVAISVNIGRKSIELGGEIASQLMNEENVNKSIHHMSSQELMDIYDNYEWNGEYDIQDNDNVKNEIELDFQALLM